MGLSIHASARHRGVTDTAVYKAIRSGRINALADGTIDPDQADAQWQCNTMSKVQKNVLREQYKSPYA